MIRDVNFLNRLDCRDRVEGVDLDLQWRSPQGQMALRIKGTLQDRVRADSRLAEVLERAYRA